MVKKVSLIIRLILIQHSFHLGVRAFLLLYSDQDDKNSSNSLKFKTLVV